MKLVDLKLHQKGSRELLRDSVLVNDSWCRGVSLSGVSSKFAESRRSLLGGGFLCFLLECEPSIEGTILDGLHDLGGADVFFASEVGEGASYFEDAVVGAGGEVELLHRLFE